MSDHQGQIKESRGVRTLLDLVDYLSAALEAKGVRKEVAYKAALEAVDQLRETYGGDRFYIPTGYALAISERDRQIYAEFTGGNHFLLAKKYGLTVRSVQLIVAKVRADESARRQMGLFGGN